MAAPLRLTPAEIAPLLVGMAGLRWPLADTGAAGLRALLAERRHIQLDPLDPMGTNADLVALARVDGVAKGEVYDLLAGHAFEHFAKERCLLPASAFPYYRDKGVATPWWRAGDRRARVDEGVVADVLAEVRERGPLTLSALSDRGRVDPLDWHGWKGTGKRTTMAIQLLWLRSAVVVCGRSGREKVYDVPERALPHVATSPTSDTFETWGLHERVAAAGLLPRVGGPWWSSLSSVRTSELPDALVADGSLLEVQVEGSRRTYLAAPDLLERAFPDDDGRMRILGPLDPLIWDRKLVEQVFGFVYLWEVYKPAAKRRWGWYVVPLLHHGRFVGRLEAKVVDGALVVSQVWREDPAFDDDALDEALARHAAALGVSLG